MLCVESISKKTHPFLNLCITKLYPELQMPGHGSGQNCFIIWARNVLVLTPKVQVVAERVYSVYPSTSLFFIKKVRSGTHTKEELEDRS